MWRVVGLVVVQSDVVDWVPLVASVLCERWQELRLWVVESGLRMGLAIWWVSLKIFGLYVGWCDRMWDSFCGL